METGCTACSLKYLHETEGLGACSICKTKSFFFKFIQFSATLYTIFDFTQNMENQGNSGIFSLEKVGNIDDIEEDLGLEFPGTEDDYVQFPSTILQLDKTVNESIIYLRAYLSEINYDIDRNYLFETDSVNKNYLICNNRL